MNFDFNAFLDSFRVMGLGMLGIFMVIIVLMVLLKIMTLIFLKKMIAATTERIGCGCKSSQKRRDCDLSFLFLPDD